MDQVPKGPVIGNPLPVQEAQIVVSVRKHIFGLVVLYVQAIFGLLAGVLLIVFLLPSIVGKGANVYAIASLALLLAITVIAVVLIVATIVYKRSQLIVTTKNITQVYQVGLFNRKISQLSLADVEDVSAEQKGVFPTIFNFGTLYVETAGEQANFHFDFCPNPNAVAKEVSTCEQAFNTRNGDSE